MIPTKLTFAKKSEKITQKVGCTYGIILPVKFRKTLFRFT